MKVLLKQDGFVLIPVLGAFFIILLSLIPFVQNQLMWKSDYLKIKKETIDDFNLESGIAFALGELKQNKDFQGNKTYIYNENTFVIQFNQDTLSPIVHCSISIPGLTYKRIYVDIDKNVLTILKWEEGFVYD